MHVFFTDRDLGKRFPELLVSSGLKVERHADLLPPDGPDTQWLEYCGRNDRVAITHNERIRYTPNELEAVVRHGVRLLLVIGKLPFLVLAQNFVVSLPRILDFVEKSDPPFIAKIYRPSPAEQARHSYPLMGTIKLWYPVPGETEKRGQTRLSTFLFLCLIPA